MSSAVPMTWRGRPIYVETEDVAVRGAAVPQSATRGNLPRSLEPVSSKVAALDFQEIIDFISTCSAAMTEAIDRLASPDAATIEFGVKVAGEAGFPMLTKVSTDATIKVTLSWKRSPPSPAAE
jgi:hypothetical protein